MYQNKIREYRKEKGLTLKELASKCEISVGYLCHLEKGSRKNPSREVMEKIASVLNENVPKVFFSNEML